MRKVGNFTLFFGADDALSNWHPCCFSYHGVDFSTVEQFMMFAKAKLFADEDAAAEFWPRAIQKSRRRLVAKSWVSIWPVGSRNASPSSTSVAGRSSYRIPVFGRCSWRLLE